MKKKAIDIRPEDSVFLRVPHGSFPAHILRWRNTLYRAWIQHGTHIIGTELVTSRLVCRRVSLVEALLDGVGG
jgi:hypothetical protein